MRNAVLLSGIWVGIILAAYAFVYSDGGSVDPKSLPVADETYMDELAGFEVPVPLGWVAQGGEGGLQLISPVRTVVGRVVAVHAVTIDEALAAAWEMVMPCVACERPPAPSIEPLVETDEHKRARAVYPPNTDGTTARAVVDLVGEAGAVLFIESGPDTPGRIAQDLMRIEKGFVVVPRVTPLEM